MSIKYCLPVSIFHFWPKLTHSLAQSLWAEHLVGNFDDNLSYFEEWCSVDKLSKPYFDHWMESICILLHIGWSLESKNCTRRWKKKRREKKNRDKQKWKKNAFWKLYDKWYCFTVGVLSWPSWFGAGYILCETVWSTCYTRAISERFRDKELIIKRYINSPSYLYLYINMVYHPRWLYPSRY